MLSNLSFGWETKRNSRILLAPSLTPTPPTSLSFFSLTLFAPSPSFPTRSPSRLFTRWKVNARCKVSQFYWSRSSAGSRARSRLEFSKKKKKKLRSPHPHGLRGREIRSARFRTRASQIHLDSSFIMRLVVLHPRRRIVVLRISRFNRLHYYKEKNCKKLVVEFFSL